MSKQRMFGTTVGAALLCAALLWSNAGEAATITVTAAQTAPGNGCSFEEAVATLNQGNPFDACQLGAGATDIINFQVTTSLYVISGLNVGIHRSVLIVGNGQTSTTLQASGGDPNGESAIEVSGGAGVSVLFQNLTLRGTDGNQLTGVRNVNANVQFLNTRVTNFGFAGVTNASTNDQTRAVFTSSMIDHNGLYGSLPLGGGILNSGFVNMSGSVVRDNFAFIGGGIASFQRVDIQESTIQDNEAIFTGGGIHSEGFVLIHDSTVTGNETGDSESGAGGGGIYFSPPGAEYLEALNNTIAYNHSAGVGGGIYFLTGTPAMGGNILANNTALGGGPDMSIVLASNAGAGGNLVGDPSGILKDGPTGPQQVPCGEIFCANPLLGPLEAVNNLAPSFSLQANSPAIDALSCQGLLDLIDQRGTLRPLDGNGDAQATCDFGAVEFVPLQPLRGFETLATWKSSVPLALSAARKTQGQFGLSVGASGYRIVTSTAFKTPVSPLSSTFRVNFFLPPNQANPFWFGSVQMFASCPSANLYNAYFGQVELTGKPTNVFSTLSFSVPSAVSTAFAQAHSDCSVSIAVNTNATPIAPVLDNLRF